MNGDYGFRVLDADGGVVLDSGSFTVRLVDSHTTPSGTFRNRVRYPLAKAKAHMFAILTHHGDYDQAGDMDDARKVMPVMPAVAVGDGWFELYPPMGGGWFHGPVTLHLFTLI